MRTYLVAWVFACALLANDAHPGLLSPHAGNIKEVMLAVPPDDFDQDTRLSRFGEASLTMIARAVGPDVKYLVHAYPAHQAAIEALFERAGISRLRFVPSAYGYYTRWTRDMFAVRNNGQVSSWVLPRQILRRLDDSVGIEVANQIGRSTVQLPVNMEGGNLVPFGAWVFAGMDLLLDGPQHLDRKRRGVFERTLAPDSNWVWLGNRHSIPYAAATGIFQPLFHIDMFLTPILKEASARPHLLVGSTQLAQELSGIPSPPAIARRLDEIAAQLQHMGFSVSRIPLLVLYQEKAVSVLSYNNVLFNGKNSRSVLLPQFGKQDPKLQVVDDYARNQFQAFGYETKLVYGPWRELGRLLGGLRCLVQVIARE